MVALKRTEPVVYTTLGPQGWDLLMFEPSSGATRTLASDPALDYDPTFSPDGRWIVFTSERRGNPDLWALDLTAAMAAPVLLTPGDTMQDAAAFSPDGRSLAFVETRDGNAEIYLMPFRPEDPVTAFRKARNLTHSSGGDFRPAFSPDGRHIAFCSDRDVPHGIIAWPDSEIAHAQGLPEQPPYATGGNIYVMGADGSNPVRLTVRDGWEGSPAWSADGQTIYYYALIDYVPYLWRMKPDGSEQKPLMSDGPPALSPTVMKNGRVAFSAPVSLSADDGIPRSWRIFSVAPDGTDLRKEGPPDRDCRGPKFRPGSGELICYGGADDRLLFEAYLATRVVQAPGQRGEVQLPDRTLGVQALHRHFPSFSPDGREIVSAVLAGSDEAAGTRLIVAPLDGGKGRELFRPEQPNFQLGSGWSGDWIVFANGPFFAPESAHGSIWKIRSDGTGSTNLTPNAQSNNAWPDISSEAGRIVFRSGRDGNFEIYLMDADGSDVRRLTNDPGRDTMPAISPDGRRVVFSSTRNGEHAMDRDLYLLDLDDDGMPNQLRRLTQGPAGDMHARFSPDGQWIVYTTSRGGFNDEMYLSFNDAGQNYGEIHAQRLSDGLVVRLTHNKWEDGAPAWGKPG